MGRSIVCGVDGSLDSEAALDVAAQLADRLGSTLILAHVAEPAYAYAAPYPSGWTTVPMAGAAEAAAKEEDSEQLLERVALAAGRADAERRVAIGHPAEKLAELADEEGAELVVVGSRGRGALRAAFLGSVSYNLVGVARCPVLIVPPGASEDHGDSAPRTGNRTLLAAPRRPGIHDAITH
jgi:nucleotide-binding universal stress UspA family protein